MDVDPRLQTNRVRDLGQTVRPSSRLGLISIGLALPVLLAFAAACAADGHDFEIFALLRVATGQWRVAPSGWFIVGAIVLLEIAVVVGIMATVRHVRENGGIADEENGPTRVDAYAQSMGHGRAVAKISRAHALRMAKRLVAKGKWKKGMEPGYPLGCNIVDGTPMSTSWEDMGIVLSGPRTGKSLCYAIPGVLSAPGPCIATSNKGDILDVTAPIRRFDHPDGRIWVFDPERIADPHRKRAPWVWNIIGSVKDLSDAKRIADCWRYASGQPQSADKNEFFTRTAATQLADYLFAAHLGGRTVSDVFRWASNERDDEPVAIISKFPEFADIAKRAGDVIGLVPETRSGVFGSLQTMVAFLADPDIIDWIRPQEGDGTPAGRPMFDPYEFATSEDTLYLLSAQGRPSTALTASLTAVTAFTAFHRAQSEFADNKRRLPVPLCCVLDEAANICRWPELADVYSYFGSAGIPIMTIWQNPDQGKVAFGETSFGSLFNNANVMVYLGGIKDTRFLGDISQLVGDRDVVRSNLSIDGSGRRSVSKSIQRETILNIADLAEWPVGRALVLASQSRAQIVRTMPWTGNRTWTDKLAASRRPAPDATNGKEK